MQSVSSYPNGNCGSKVFQTNANFIGKSFIIETSFPSYFIYTMSKVGTLFAFPFDSLLLNKLQMHFRSLLLMGYSIKFVHLHCCIREKLFRRTSSKLLVICINYDDNIQSAELWLELLSVVATWNIRSIHKVSITTSQLEQIMNSWMEWVAIDRENRLSLRNYCFTSSSLHNLNFEKAKKGKANSLTALTPIFVGSPTSPPAMFRWPSTGDALFVICLANIAPKCVCGSNWSTSFKVALLSANRSSSLSGTRYNISCVDFFWVFFIELLCNDDDLANYLSSSQKQQLRCWLPVEV